MIRFDDLKRRQIATEDGADAFLHGGREVGWDLTGAGQEAFGFSDALDHANSARHAFSSKAWQRRAKA